MFSKAINLLSNEKTISRISVVVFVIILLLVSFGQVSYNDFFWHLALGKWMIAKHSFLTHDIFSQNFTGKLWLNGTWVFDGLIYLIYTKFSFLGLNILRFVIFAATYYFFIKAALVKRNVPLAIVIGLFLLTVPSIRNFFRPEITQPLFIGYFLYVLYKYKYFKSKLIFTLPFVEILWVNVHGSFQFGPLLISIFLGSELLRTLIRYYHNVPLGIVKNQLIKIYALILVLTSAATLINPYGYQMYTLISEILGDTESLSHIAEWQPLPFNFFLNFEIGPNIFITILCLAAVLMLVRKIWMMWASEKKILGLMSRMPYEEPILLGAGIALTMQHIRFVSMLTIISAIVLLRLLPLLRSLMMNRLKRPLFLFLGLIGCLIFTRSSFALNTGPAHTSEPRESLTFIKKEKLKGAMFNEYVDGGQLIWDLYPDYKVFIDGRTPNLYDGSFYWKYRAAQNPALMKKILDDNNIQFIIFPNGSPLLKDLLSSDEWALVFFDNYASVYVRRDGDNKEVATREYKLLNIGKAFDSEKVCAQNKEQDAFFSEINRNIHELQYPLLGIFSLSKIALDCEMQNLYPRLEAEISTILAHGSLSTSYASDLYHYRGTLRLRMDRPSEALSDIKKALAGNPMNPEYLVSLGDAYFNLDQFNKAKKAFEKAQIMGDVQSLPLDFYQTYGWTLYHLDDNAKALEYQLRYVYLAKENQIKKENYLYLSKTYNDLGNQEKAFLYQAKADTL